MSFYCTLDGLLLLMLDAGCSIRTCKCNKIHTGLSSILYINFLCVTFSWWLCSSRRSMAFCSIFDAMSGIVLLPKFERSCCFVRYWLPYYRWETITLLPKPFDNFNAFLIQHFDFHYNNIKHRNVSLCCFPALCSKDSDAMLGAMISFYIIKRFFEGIFSLDF